MLLTRPKKDSQEVRFDANDLLIAQLKQRLGFSDLDSYRRDQGIVKEGTAYRSDAGNAHIFGLRVLEEVEQQLVRQETPVLWSMRRIPTKRNLPLGLLKDTVPYQRYQGTPKFATGSSSDVNLVKYTVDEESQNVGVYELAYDYTYMELEYVAQASKSNLYAYARDIVAEKAMATIALMDEYDHLLACFGDTKQALNGFLNHPSVNILNQVGTFDPYAQTTAEALNDWFIGTIRDTIRQGTNLIGRPNYIGLTEGLNTKLLTTYMSGSNGVTAYDLIQKSMASMGIMAIEPVIELNATFMQQRAGLNGTTERLVIGELSDLNLDRRISPFDYDPWVQLPKGQLRNVKRAARSIRMKHPRKFLYVNHAAKP